MISKKFFVLLAFMLSFLATGSFLYYIINQNTIQVGANYLNSYVINQLSEIFPTAQIKIKGTDLTWQRVNENFILSSKGVSISIDELAVDIDIPEISLDSRAGILFLLKNFHFVSITIPKLEIIIKNSEQESAFNVEDSVRILKKVFDNVIKFDMPLQINNIIVNKENSERLYINRVILQKRKEQGREKFYFGVSSNDFSLAMKAFINDRDILALSAEYSNIKVDFLRYFNAISRGSVFDRNVKLSGNFSLEIDKNGKISNGKINVNRLNGNLRCYESQDCCVNGWCYVDNLEAEVEYSDKLLKINSIKSKIDGIKVFAFGEVNFENEKIDMTITADKVNVSELCNYWPKDLQHETRLWYCDNVLSGDFFNIKFIISSDIDKFWHQKSLLNTKITANIKEAIIKFDDRFETVNIIDGKLSIDSQEFHVSVDKGKFREIDISLGNIKIDDIYDEDGILKINGNAFSNAQQVYRLVDDGKFIKLDEKYISGKAQSEFKFQLFNINHPTKKLELSTYIQSKITSLSISNIFDNFDVYDSVVTLELKDNNIDVQANGLMNNKRMSLKVKYNVDNSNNTNCEFFGYLSENNIKKLNFLKYDGFKGGVLANIKYFIDNQDHSKLEGALDVSDIELNFPYFDFVQNSNRKKNLYFSAMIQDKNQVYLDSAAIRGEDIDIEFHGKISNGVNLIFDKIKYLKNNVNAHLQATNNEVLLKVKGDFIDLSDSVFSTKVYSANKFDSINVQLNSKNIRMKNNVMVHNVNVILNCDNKKGCVNSELSGYFSDNLPLSARYSGIGLEVFTENAGLFLKSLDLLKTIDGGKLSFYLYPIKKNQVTNGMLSLTKFNLINASILAQILTLSSLQGIVNVLNGNGIYFESLNVPFTYYNHLANIEESWMEGSEIGISLGGKINIVKKSFDIKGQIIPAYIINKSIWKIPIIGKILTGGKSRGIIAIDYKVKGDEKKNSLSVNLISILTPNLLKRVLQSFDEKITGVVKKQNIRTSINTSEDIYVLE